ncbi:PAS domain-containing protein [Marinilabilia salmonicolor]|uniref:PAS domain-containing protein n=1 Tax=Marinilabilia salmonicolor TaxID=989 RepID=UPI00029B34EA|nr:PAS domain-containing protein [Marinilabilia salmonicolor]
MQKENLLLPLIEQEMILIRYFAVRDDEGNYLGTLEVSQDLTELRKLEDEQRILNYES